MKMWSPAFKEGGIIPSRYTCEGKNINPPLQIKDVPPLAKSLVLIIDDPDVPKKLYPIGVFDHWVVYNISPHQNSIQENSIPGVEGVNSSGNRGYTGPCPPDREHRYFFKIYALDVILDLPAGKTKKEVEAAIDGHVLMKYEFIGRYEKDQGY